MVMMRRLLLIYLIIHLFIYFDTQGIQLKSSEIIRNRLSLTSIVDRITSVDPHSGLCICPFHDDKSPSMKVNEGPGYYYCFACGESGNAVKFVSKILNITYDEAIQSCLKIIESVDELHRLFPEGTRNFDTNVVKESGKAVRTADVKHRKQDICTHTGITTYDEKFSNDTIVATLNLAKSFFMTRLFVDPDAIDVRNYLKSRGISVGTAKVFQLGYAPRGRTITHKMQLLNNFDETSSSALTATWSLWEDIKYHSLTSWITNRALLNGTEAHHSLEQLVASGLAVNSSVYTETSRYSGGRIGSNPIYDRFRHRLMIPIRSLEGEVIGFGGRELPENSTNYLTSIKKFKSPGKYINTPTSKVFRKKETLFNADIASKHSERSSYVILVEGYFDVIALFEVGMNNVVASMGTALSLQQILLASRLSNTGTVILLFDQDAAGIKALQRVEEILEKQDQKQRRGISDLQLNGLTVKAGSMKDAVDFLRDRYSSNSGVIKTLEKVKDCADLALAVDKVEVIEAMSYLASQARLIKSM